MILKQKVKEVVSEQDDLTVCVTFEDADSIEAFTAACVSQGAVRVQMGMRDGRVWAAVK